MTAAQWLRDQHLPAEDADLSAEAEAYVKKGGARSLKAGGQWIYDNELDRTEGEVRDGDILRVRDFDGYPLGYGFINSRSKIRIRMLARYRTEGITPAFLRKRVEDAWAYRRAVMGEDLDCCRVIFGEADYLPGITVDRFGDVLVTESLALGTDRLKLLILRALADCMEKDGCPVRGIYERSDAKVRRLEGMEQVRGFIGPGFDTQIPIAENGIRYLVDVRDGQKTGFFLDQKYNRRAAAGIVRNLCRGAYGGGADCDGSIQKSGVRVLDCFTHTGSFGLNCAAAGASEVLSVDASRTAILQAEQNARLNGLKNISFRTADVFELLPELERAGERYDMVILDPPAFTKSRQATKNAVKGYREINLRGMRLVRDGGFLATCTCSHFMDEELFKKTLAEAAHGARRRLRQVELRAQGPDHPVLWGSGESYYLKFYIFQVVEER